MNRKTFFLEKDLTDTSGYAGGRSVEKNEAVELSAQQIDALSSAYLKDGAFLDCFEIDRVQLMDWRLVASTRIVKFGISPQDAGGYHLTAPTVFRLVAQLAVIHGHAIMGFDQKCVEVWVREHHMKHRRPVRDPNHITVEYEIKKFRPVPGKPSMYGFEYAVELCSGAVRGGGSAFFDLAGVKPSSKFMADLAKFNERSDLK